MSEVKANPDAAEPKRRWFEPLAAIVMALATLSTAWCSYQSARWTAVSGRYGKAADNLQRRAMALHLEANQMMTVQAQMFMQWVNAHLATNDTLAGFYAARFGPELEKAFAVWLAQKPFESRGAAPHPFVPGLYESRFNAEEKEALAELP
jgi:hypothetical protein